MKSLLNALQEGRLLELPDADKGKALEYLANVIEAVPDLSGVGQVHESVMARESSQNTGLGLGVACPHVRASGEGELFCAVGWSPIGIDYGSSDGKKVHLVVMYYIPDSQKSIYLREISALAGAIHREGGISAIASAEDIATVRERLLDWVLVAIEANIPESQGPHDSAGGPAGCRRGPAFRACRSPGADSGGPCLDRVPWGFPEHRPMPEPPGGRGFGEDGGLGG